VIITCRERYLNTHDKDTPQRHQRLTLTNYCFSGWHKASYDTPITPSEWGSLWTWMAVDTCATPLQCLEPIKPKRSDYLEICTTDVISKARH